MSNEIITPKERSVQWLLNQLKTGNLKIPAYQRPYEWLPVNNQALYEDLTDFGNYENIHDEENRYYLGPIYTGGDQELLDGQQRGISLVIWNNAELAARSFYEDWLSSVRNDVTKLTSAKNVLSSELKTNRTKLRDDAVSLTEDLKVALKKAKIVLEKKLFKSLTSDEKQLGRLNELVEAATRGCKKSSESNDECDKLIESLKTLLGEIKLESVDDAAASVNENLEHLKANTISLYFEKKKELLKSKKRNPEALQAFVDDVIHEYDDVVSALRQLENGNFSPEPNPIAVQCENHVTDFLPLEALWKSLLTGRFRLRKKEDAESNPVFELELEIRVSPELPDQSEGVFDRWTTTKKEDSFISLGELHRIIGKNSTLAPFRRRYLLAFVFYFYKTFGSILKWIEYPLDETDNEEITVNFKKCSDKSLFNISNDVLIVEMRLKGFISPEGAQRMFHTINARGVGLSDADKVRNLLLSRTNHEDITKAFSDLVEMFQSAAKNKLSLGFSEDDVFYWAHHYIEGGSITQKEFVKDVEHKLGSADNDNYAEEFVSYMRKFSRFIRWISLIHSPDTNAGNWKIWKEFRLVLEMNFPKATYPLLFSIYEQFNGKVRSQDELKYQYLVRGIGYFFAMRRDRVFVDKPKKTESISALLVRTMRAVQIVKNGTGASHDQLQKLIGIFYPKMEPDGTGEGDASKLNKMLIPCDSNKEDLEERIFGQVLANRHESVFYGGQGKSAITKYVLTLAASVDGGYLWHADIEHLYHSQSKNHSDGNRLGNLFLLDPRLNRSMGDLDAEEKYKALNKRIRENNDDWIEELSVFKWLRQNFADHQGAWSAKSESQVRKLFKTREESILNKITQDLGSWRDEMKKGQ